MELNKIPKEIIDKIPANVLYSTKARKETKLFFHELLRLINEKSKINENLVNIKKEIHLLIKNIFPERYQYFYYENNIQSLEIFIFCLCNQLETLISKMVEGYKSFDFSINDPDLNLIMDLNNKSKDIIPSFMISFYDFFEDELVINNEDVINTVIETNTSIEDNNMNAKSEKTEINNSFLISIIKIINVFNRLSICDEEFKNIFTDGMKGNYSNFYDMGFLLIKIIESIIKVNELATVANNKNNNININIDKNLSLFIKISYNNIIPCLSEFFVKTILNYHLKSTFNIILKKEEFIILFTKLSSVRIIREKLLYILTITNSILKPEQENYCKKIVNKHKILDKIIRHIINDLNTKKDYTTKDILSEIKFIIIYFGNTHSFSSKIEESICSLFNNILQKNIKNDKNCISSFNLFFEELNSFIKNFSDEDKYKIFNLMISLFQSAPLLSRQIVKIFLENFKDNVDFYEEMIGKTNFFNVLVRNLYKCDGEIINNFFEFLLNLFNNFDYFPKMELTNLINSITFFTEEEVKNLKIFIQNLIKFNNLINQKKRNYTAYISIANSSLKSNRKKSAANLTNTPSNAIIETADLFQEINQNFIDILLNIINDIINQAKNKTNENCFKPELIYELFDYIQEIIKNEAIYQYFSSKNFLSLFHSLVCINNYKGVAYKIIEIFLKSSKDKENNEAYIKLILNRYISLFNNDQKEKDEKKLYYIEINKFKELLFMYKTLKVTFIMETLSEKATQKNMNENIIYILLKYFDYINDNKKYIFKVYNKQFHLYFKEYIDFLFELLIISNENVINKQNALCPKLNYKNFDKIIYKTLLFFKGLNNYNQNNNNNVVNKPPSEEINQNSNKKIKNDLPNSNENFNNKSSSNDTPINYTNKITKSSSKSINSSLNFFPSDNQDEQSDIINNFDYLYDIIKYFADKSLNIKNEQGNGINIDLDKYYISKYKINKIIFEKNKTKNLISNFIVQSPFIIVLLLDNLYKLEIFLEKFLEFIYLLCLTNENNTIYLLRQNILKILLNITSNSLKYNCIILKILTCCFKFLSKEELKIILDYLIKMFNNNNHSFTKDIIKMLNNTISIVTSSDYDYSKGVILSNYCIKQPNAYNIININNLNLSSNSDSNIVIKQEVYFYNSINTDNKLVLLKLENEFFGGNKSKQFLEISLFNYNLSVNENDSKSDNNSEKKEDNIVLNAKDFISLNDINIFNYTFNRNEKILSVSVNGKNMYCYEYLFNFPNIENKKGNNKYNINNNSIFITIGYPLESIKEIEDKTFFIFPHIKLLSLDIKIENSSKEKASIYKMKLDNIKLLDKNYYKLTNFKLDEDTILISKYNSYDSLKINSIYFCNNINIILYNNIFFINTYISYSLDYTFRLEKYLFILLNSLNLDNGLFKLLMDLLCSYFMINRKYLPKFLGKEEIMSSLYFIIYKNAHFLDKSIIEITLPALLSYDKLNSTIATDILLDNRIFQRLNNETKKELLILIDRKLLIDDYNLDNLLFNNLFNLLILCCNDTAKKSNISDLDDTNSKSIDELIIEIICKIIFKNSKTPSFIDIVKEKFCLFFNFHTFVKSHITTFNKGRPKDTYQIISSFFKKMFINDYILKIKNIFIKLINEKINLDKVVKTKLITICNTYDSKDNNYFIFKEGDNNFEIKNQYEPKDSIFDDNEVDSKKNKYTRHKSFQIFKKEEIEQDSKAGIIRKSKKKRTLTEDTFSMKGVIGGIGNSNSKELSGKLNCIQVKINLPNQGEIYCNGDCILCKFLKKLVKDLFFKEMNFNIFEKYMLNNYSETYMLNNNLDYNLSFSYYLMKNEGISRIRKNFQLKVDKIANFEIDRSTDEEKKNAKKNDIQRLFYFYKRRNISENLCDLFNLSQIFDIELITDCLDENDSFKNCYNCLLFEGLNYINSVLILGREKIYLLTYVNISNNYLLYSAINPIPRTFWVQENYNNILLEQCKYLEMFDHINELNKKSSKSLNNEDKTNKNSDIFKKEEKGFQMYSFYYKEINEIHKKKFLHQNNAIEIFLKNGKNYYLAFNIDLRDIIVGMIIQNMIEAYNLRNKNLYINNLNHNEFNNNISNGSLSNTDITSNSNSNSNNNGYSFEINNNSASTVKNENMIFMRNINLFIEKEKNKVQKNKIPKSKGKKTFCKITDTKEILEQSMEKWSNGFLNTYSYIMILNTLSGRTYNNLAQYPVYPWILKDYSSKEIDLNESETYRDLSYPIYAQDDETRENLKLKYESFEDNEIKYHCGSHYSNCGFVCYYLIRVKPFSNIAAEIQGRCFDTPDRLFFNIQKFYVVQEKYQELIPDIFNLPELYINVNNYVYGQTTDNFQVVDVVLPPWAVNSPRVFSKMNKKALESQYVSQHINDWIDLIFGYKRSGTEAEKYYNILKNIFSNFDPKKDEEDMIEANINELCEMGIDPIQLFTKAHPKRERHQIMKAFFGKSVFLTFFEARESDNYQIKNFHSSSKIKEIYSYYEKNNGILSHGEGGLSSFRMTYENDPTFLKGKSNDNKDAIIYFVVGEKKTLLPPSYKNFIEWGVKNTFIIYKPFKNIKFTFKIKHMKKFNINCIKVTSDGKYIVIGYDNGVIEKYRLKKINNCYIEEVLTIFNKEGNNISLPGNISQDMENQKHTTIKKNKSKGKKILKSIFNFKGLNSKKAEVDERFNNISSSSFHNNQNIGISNNLNNLSSNINNNNDGTQVKMIIKNHVIFNPQLSMSSSNILNSECILLNHKNDKFIQYNSIQSEIHPHANSKENIEGYYFHSKNPSELKHLSKQSSSNNGNSQKGYVIFLANSSHNILAEVNIIDICDSYSFMLVIDKMNRIYLYNFHSFKLLRYIDISSIFTNQIKFSSICPYTGDFIISSSKNVVLMNINGVFLSQMNNFKSKINSCFISIIPQTESDLFVFTGHKDGTLIVSKLVNNLNTNIPENNKSHHSDNIKKINKINQLYQEAFNNNENNYEKYLDNKNLSLFFDIVIKIKCSENPLRYIKLTEDLTEIICIDNKNKLIYITYEKFFVNRKENKHKKNLKTCPMCKSAISSSKILCHICGKKLCSNCKVEKILPEYSFKNPKAICEDCLQLINSTNKMLYDF